MGRTPGAKNKTAIEMEREAKHMAAMAKLKAKMEKLKKEKGK